MSNRSLGNQFESDFAELLAQHGFWVHRLAQNAAGQPADIIAVKRKRAYLIDCKVCSSKGFPLSRVEDNQHYAMDLWRYRSNGEGLFAIRHMDGKITMLTHMIIKHLQECKTVASEADLDEYGTSFEEWVNDR